MEDDRTGYVLPILLKKLLRVWITVGCAAKLLPNYSKNDAGSLSDYTHFPLSSLFVKINARNINARNINSIWLCLIFKNESI